MKGISRKEKRSIWDILVPRKVQAAAILVDQSCDSVETNRVVLEDFAHGQSEATSSTECLGRCLVLQVVALIS